MFKGKLRVLAAITISCCLLMSQVVLAEAEDVKTEKVKIEQSAVDTTKDATTKINLEAAKKIIKGFKFTEGFEFTNAYLENQKGPGQPVWRMDLNDNKNSGMTVSISADTGELINYYFYLWQMNNNKYIATITKKQAKEAADKFIKEYVELDGKTLELIPVPAVAYEKSRGIYEMPQYSFNYALKVNGIIVGNSNYQISVDASTGKVTSYYSPSLYLPATEYPSAEGVKDSSTLKSKYAELLQMQLQYSVGYENNKPKVNIIYVPFIPGLLNAKTLDTGNEPYYDVQSLNKDKIVPDAKIENKKITEEEAKKTAENTKAYVEKLTGTKFSDNNINIAQVLSPNKETTRNFYYSASDPMGYGLIFSINLSTGNIVNLSFYKYNVGNNESKVNEKISYNDAKKTSDEIIKNIFAKQYGLFSDNSEVMQKMQLNQKDQPAHQFTYMRFENGISTSDSININIDKETGKPTQINFYWNDIEYPKPVNIISAEKAKELYLKEVEFQLAYYTPYDIRNGLPVKESESIIIFRPKDDAMVKYIDAAKGITVDYGGGAFQQKYSNENHWASVNIEMLETQGIVLNSITDYDQKLTRQDAVKMLSLVSGVAYNTYNGQIKSSFPDVSGDNEYLGYIESAVTNNIIKANGKNFEGKQNITKQEFIDMLINVLGYQDITGHPELFAKTDSNINVSICRVLDILPVKPGATFNAKDNITFAEAAYSLQKALKYIR